MDYQVPRADDDDRVGLRLASVGNAHPRVLPCVFVRFGALVPPCNNAPVSVTRCPFIDALSRTRCQVEAAVATRSTDTVQIVQHLKRLVECLALTTARQQEGDGISGLDPGAPAGGAAGNRHHNHHPHHRNTKGGKTNAGSNSSRSDATAVAAAVHRGLEKLLHLYNDRGKSLFQSIHGSQPASCAPPPPTGTAIRSADGGGGGGDFGGGCGGGAANAGGTAGSSSSSTSLTTDCSLEDDDDNVNDAFGGDEADKERRMLALQLENRLLKEDILDLKWQLKRARADHHHAAAAAEAAAAVAAAAAAATAPPLPVPDPGLDTVREKAMLRHCSIAY